MRKTKSNPPKTLLTICVGFLALHLIFKWNWAIWLSFFVGLIGVFSDSLSKKFESWWMKLAGLLGLLIPNLLLSIIFFLVLTPLAFLSRIFGKLDPLLLKNRLDSTFAERKKDFEKSDFEKTW